MKKVSPQTEKIIKEIEHKILTEIHLLTELQMSKVEGDKKKFGIRKSAYTDILGIMKEVTGLEFGVALGTATPTQDRIEERIKLENLLAYSLKNLSGK